MLLIAMTAVMLLPRQFHVLVVQNPRERDVHTAAWAFPLYLLAINIFVLPIAFAGLLEFRGGRRRPTASSSPCPCGRTRSSCRRHRVPGRLLGGHGHDRGGFPGPVQDDLQRHRAARAAARAAAWQDVYWTSLPPPGSASSAWSGSASCGRASRPASSCSWRWGCSPSSPSPSARPPSCSGSTGGEGNRRGAFAGISAGFAMWFYTLIVPDAREGGRPRAGVLERAARAGLCCGPPRSWGWKGSTRSAMGCSGRSSSTSAPIVLVSLLTEQDADERSQAAAFVGVAGGEARPGVPAILSVPEIERLIHHYVRAEEADAILRELLDGQGARRPHRCPSCWSCGFASSACSPPPSGAAAARYIIEDRFTISKGEAQELVDSFQTHAALAADRGGGASDCSPRWSRASRTASSPPTSTAGSSR